MSTKFPRSGLAVCGAVSCFGHVLSILASIYTHCVVEHPTWPCWPRSPGSLCVACKSFSYTGQGSEPLAERATEVPVTVPLHAWSGQGQLVTGPSLVTISSQLVREPIIITRSGWPRRPEVGRLVCTLLTHTRSDAGPLSNLRLELRCQILYQSVLSNFAETSDPVLYLLSPHVQCCTAEGREKRFFTQTN